jgi:PAS domain S-box-containing protein
MLTNSKYSTDEIDQFKVTTNRLSGLIEKLQHSNPELATGTENLLFVVAQMLDTVVVSENARFASEANLLAILENTKDSIWSIDADYSLVSFNSAFKSYFLFVYGVELEASVNILEQLPEDTAAIWKERFDRVFKGESFSVEDRVAFENIAFYFETSFNPIVGKNRFIEGVSVFSREITKRKEAEVERDRLIAELQSALRFKDEFLATMSHELRTPLNAIIGFTGVVRMRSDELSDHSRHLLDRVAANGSRLLSLINNILDVSRIAAGRLEIVPAPVKIYDLVEEWQTDFNQQAEKKGLELKVVIDSSLPNELYIDKERVTQIVTNLLSNAFKFTENGWVKLQIEAQQKEWIIQVSDTGPGIPETYQDLIFDEFRQVDASSSRKHGGAGLGLSIVKKLCILMNGRVNVASIPGEGSAFTVALPLLPVPTPSI